MRRRGAKVLLLIDRFWPTLAGAEVQAVRLIRSMKQLGYTFAVVTSKLRVLPDTDDLEGTPVYRFPFYVAFEGSDVGAILALRRQVSNVIRAYAPDLVHLTGFGPTVFFNREARQGGAPLVFDISCPLPDTTADRASAMGRAIREADWVTAISQSVLDRARALAPEIATRSSVIHYGVDEPDLTPSALPTDPPRILCLGRLLDVKGFDLALAAFPIILDRLPNVQLVIAGDGDARDSLERQARDLGVGHAVEFIGAVAPEEVFETINEATVVLVPSRSESFGLVAIESALMARPVVAARVGALPELVAHGETGILVEKDDVEALSRATIELIERPKRAVHLGQAARQRAIREFSLERYTRQYDALYQNLLRSQASR